MSEEEASLSSAGKLDLPEAQEHLSSSSRDLPKDERHLSLSSSGEDSPEIPVSFFVYVQCYFVIIATILGTGILALPVELSHSGFSPFMATYVANYFMQVLVVVYMVDLLQRGQALEAAREMGEPVVGGVMMVNLAPEGEDGDAEAHVPAVTRSPDLHTLGELFLGPWACKGFDVAVLFHFLSILISYCLAGSQAYGNLMGINFAYLIPAFWAVFTSVILFGQRLVAPVISFLTFLKGSLLVVMVFITGYLALQINQDEQQEWATIGEPFLMSTVALGGAVNLMPVIFEKIPRQAKAIGRFRDACLLGLTTVAILTLLYCMFLLKIVPQEAEGDSVSLSRARENGEISTVPLTKVILTSYPQYKWIATTVQAFVMLSVTVSYMTIGAGTKHTLAGMARKFDASGPAWRRALRSQDRRCALLYGASFTVVLGVCLANPKGFVDVLEVVTSMALNLETGVFIVMMLQTAQAHTRALAIPLPLSPYTFAARWVVVTWFGYAVVYDLASTTWRLAAGSSTAAVLLALAYAAVAVLVVGVYIRRRLRAGS